MAGDERGDPYLTVSIQIAVHGVPVKSGPILEVYDPGTARRMLDKGDLRRMVGGNVVREVRDALRKE